MATTRRRLVRALAIAAVVPFFVGPVGLASAETQVAFTIQDSRITESSGLAADSTHQVYWTVNDSDDQGTVYGLTDLGQVKGIVGFRTKPVDVEAVAMSGGRLYVADIGDNLSKRDTVSVYYFDDPQPNNQTVPYRSYDFSYPDGAHDAETLLVNGDGRLYIVTKGLQGGIYEAPKKPSRQGVNKLRRVGDAPAFVTDGTFLPGGDKIALRTYVSVEVLDASTYKTVAQEATPPQRQGESLTVSLDGSSLLIGSEGKRSTVLRIPVPTQVSDVPSANSTPPSTAKATPTPTPTDPADSQDDDPDADQSADSPVNRTGTILSLSLAAFVALVAGVVVAAVRKP